MISQCCRILSLLAALLPWYIASWELAGSLSPRQPVTRITAVLPPRSPRLFQYLWRQQLWFLRYLSGNPETGELFVFGFSCYMPHQAIASVLPPPDVPITLWHFYISLAFAMIGSGSCTMLPLPACFLSDRPVPTFYSYAPMFAILA